MKVKIEITYDDNHHEDSISEELKRSQAELHIAMDRLRETWKKKIEENELKNRQDPEKQGAASL